MKIKIYQINTDRDNYGCAFMGMEWLKKTMGTDTPDSTIYDRVFDGEIRGTSPEYMPGLTGIFPPVTEEDPSLYPMW